MDTFNEYLDVVLDNLIETAVEQPEVIRNITDDLGLTYDETVVMIKDNINEFRDDPEWMERYDRMLNAIGFLSVLGQDHMVERVFDAFGSAVIKALCARLEAALLKQNVN